MAITKPYTFQAGTKARAGEVNQDFDILYSEVNRIGTEILNIDVDIQDILASKADVNGNATQRFQMANPEASYDGVNKTFLENAISNIKEYISGYIITKDTENTIIVSPGSCYDSNFATIMISTGNITKENTTQSADTTYYIHAISDNTGRQVDVLISTQSIEPPLPYGYSLYRQIGNFTTDSNGNIAEIIYYGKDLNMPSNVASLTQSYVNGTSGYLVYSNGLKIQWGQLAIAGNAGAQDYTITFLKKFSTTNYIPVDSAFYAEQAGDKVNYYGCIGRETGSMKYRVFQERWATTGTLWWMVIGY